MNKWGFWGAVETVAKLVGIVAALIAAGAGFSAAWGWGSGLQIAAWILLVLISLTAIAQLGIRLGQKNTFTTIFAVLNLLGHLAMVLVLLHPAASATLPLVFAWTFFVGQAAKLIFLRVTGYTEGGNTPASLFGLTAVQAAIYLASGVLLAI